MKKILAVILAIVYLVSSAGATVHTHYCMGKAYSVDFVKTKDECSKCGMKSTKHCCNDVIKTIKLRDSHSAVTTAINVSVPFFAIVDKTHDYIFSDRLFGAPSFSTHNNSPPSVSGDLICILNCVFRI